MFFQNRLRGIARPAESEAEIERIVHRPFGHEVAPDHVLLVVCYGRTGSDENSAVKAMLVGSTSLAIEPFDEATHLL